MATPVTIRTFTFEPGKSYGVDEVTDYFRSAFTDARLKYGEVRFQFDGLTDEAQGIPYVDEVEVHVVGYTAHQLVPSSGARRWNTPCAVCDFPVDSDVHR